MKRPSYKLGAFLGLVVAAIVGSVSSHDDITGPWLAIYPAGLLLGVFVVRVVRHRRGYQAAAQVARWRRIAEDMRVHDHSSYAQIIDTADVPMNDQDAYVALFLAAASEKGAIGGPEDFYA